MKLQSKWRWMGNALFMKIIIFSSLRVKCSIIKFENLDVFYHDFNVWNERMWDYFTCIFAEVQDVTFKI